MLSLGLALALAAAHSSSGVKWVPLKSAPAPRAKKVAPRNIVQPTGADTTTTLTVRSDPVVASAVAAPGPAASDAQRRLDLTCLGLGTANKVKIATVDSDSSFSGIAGGQIFSGSGSGSATITSSRQQDFRDQVDIRLFNGDDRIRMPRTMLPAIRGGKDGWFKLKDVIADARAIRASVAVNILNNPKVHIDRVTGTISISGKAGDYAGQCEVIDATAAPRF